MKSVTKHLAAAILLVLFCTEMVLSAVRLTPDGETGLPVPFEYLIDKEGSYTFDTIRESGKFTSDERINFGFTTDNIWARFTVEIEEPLQDTWFLEINYPLLDRIEVYIPRRDTTYRKEVLGDHLPFWKRPVKHQNFNVPLPMNPGKHLCYLRITSTSSITIPLKAVPQKVMFEEGI